MSAEAPFVEGSSFRIASNANRATDWDLEPARACVRSVVANNGYPRLAERFDWIRAAPRRWAWAWVGTPSAVGAIGDDPPPARAIGRLLLATLPRALHVATPAALWHAPLQND